MSVIFVSSVFLQCYCSSGIAPATVAGRTFNKRVNWLFSKLDR